MVKHNALKGFYDVERTIGCGGFAKVKLATHLATGEKVAIKVMEKSLLKDDLPRVRIELKALKSLSHEHICKLYQVIETETHFFIVMEYCSGGELFDHIVEKNRLTETESRSFFRQILSAVAYLHGNGYAHRDLKPENVLLDSSHQLKLIDFGLCAHPDGGVQNGALFTSCGSPTYAAPELVLGQQYMGAQVDVWAMGVLLYALLAGHLPFDDQNIDRLYRKILSGKYEEPHCMSLPSRRLIRAMLQVDPLQRITVNQLLQHSWMTAGGMPAIRLPRTPLNKHQQSFMVDNAEDADIIELMSFYHGASTVDMRCHLMRGKYDYDTATYLLLVAKRRRGLPIGLISGAATRLPIRIKSSDSIQPSVTPNKIRRTTRSTSKITRQHLDTVQLPPPPPFSFNLKSPLPVTPTTTYKRNENYKQQRELEQSENKMGTPKNQRINMGDKTTSTSAKTNTNKAPLVVVQCNTSYSWVQQSDFVDQLLSPAPALPRLLRPRIPAVVCANWTANAGPIGVRTSNGSAGIRKPIKRIRSPNLDGEYSPVPNKKSAPATPVMQTSEMNKLSQNGIENGGSARKVLESIERSLHRVKNVLTPRKNIEMPSQPAILNNKNLCNVSTTQCTDAEFVIEELSKALRKKGICCNRKGFTIRGKMDPPLLMSSPVAGTSAGNGCSFELEICYLPQMGLLPSTSISNASAAISNGNSSHTPKRSGGGGCGPGGSNSGRNSGMVARLRSSNGGRNNVANVTQSPVQTRNARRSAGDGPAQHQVEPSAMVGIRRKRLKGDSWCYKKVCEQVLALTATDLKQIKESVV